MKRALVLGSVCIVLGCDDGRFVEGPVFVTKSQLQAVYSVADGWRVTHGNVCPTWKGLEEEKELAASSNGKDAWGRELAIVCEEHETRIVSAGSDGVFGTRDDIVFPLGGVS